MSPLMNIQSIFARVLFIANITGIWLITSVD